MNKRVILCGPTASGKTFIRSKFAEKGYTYDVSYTSREPRNGEIDGKDYKFISSEEFSNRIFEYKFFEWVNYEGNYYGTGQRTDSQAIFVRSHRRHPSAHSHA